MNKIHFLIVLLVIILFISVSNTLQHEHAHKQISIYNGCEDARIGFDFKNMYAYSQGLNCEPNEYRNILHSQNEIVGYNVTSILVTLILCTGLISWILIDKKEII